MAIAYLRETQILNQLRIDQIHIQAIETKFSGGQEYLKAITDI